MELCSDGEDDSRRSYSNVVRPSEPESIGGRMNNNPLLPQPLENWYIVVRKSKRNGGSCIFPSWKDYRANLSSLFDTSRNRNSSTSGTEDVTELAAFPSIVQCMEYLNQNQNQKLTNNHPSSSTSVPPPPPPPAIIAKATAATTTTTIVQPPFSTIPNSRRGGRLGISVHNFTQHSQSRSHQRQRQPEPRHEHQPRRNNNNNNNKFDAIPDVVTTILNDAFPHQSGKDHKSRTQQSRNTNVTDSNTIEILDDDHDTTTTKTPDRVSSKTKTTVSPNGNDNEAGKKRQLFSGKSDTSTTSGADVSVKRIRNEISPKTASDQPNTSSLDALAMAAISTTGSKQISQRQSRFLPAGMREDSATMTTTTTNKNGRNSERECVPRARSPPTVIVRGASGKRGQTMEDTIRRDGMRRASTSHCDDTNNISAVHHHQQQQQYMRQQQQQQHTPALTLKIPEVPRGFVPIPVINRTISESQYLLDISNNSTSSMGALCGSTTNSGNSFNSNHSQQQQQQQPQHDYQQLYNYQQMVDLTAIDDSDVDSDRTRKHRNVANRPSRFSPSWTISDDSRLIKIVKRSCSKSKGSPSYPADWEPISKALDNGKSAEECKIHWIRYLMRGSKGGFWTEEEDEIIFNAIAKEERIGDDSDTNTNTNYNDTVKKQQPFRKEFWIDLSQRLHGRDAKQSRDRWFGILNPVINHYPFTPEEDIKLWEAYNALGRKWASISEVYFNLTRPESVLINQFEHSLYIDFINLKYGPNTYQLGTAAREKKIQRAAAAAVDE